MIILKVLFNSFFRFNSIILNSFSLHINSSFFFFLKGNAVFGTALHGGAFPKCLMVFLEFLHKGVSST